MLSVWRCVSREESWVARRGMRGSGVEGEGRGPVGCEGTGEEVEGKSVRYGRGVV